MSKPVGNYMNDILKKYGRCNQLPKELEGPVKEAAKELADVLRKEFGDPEERNMIKSCDSCNFLAHGGCRECLSETLENWKSRELKDAILFHHLNGLTPTFSSCRDKVYEEIGEVMQLLGKGQRASGERVYPAALGPEQDSYADWIYRVFEEILDSAQSLVTMAFVLAEENNIDVQGEIGRHEAKLIKKGYLVESEVQI